MPTRAARWMVRLERLAGTRGYPAALGCVSLLDYYAPFLPLNLVLAAAVLPRPERWRVLGLSFAAGAALGAVILAALVGAVGPEIVAWIAQSRGAPLWARIEGFVGAFGLAALAALAISPLPVRIAVVVLALAGTHPLLVGAVVGAGRVVVYPAIALLASRAPHLLLRVPAASRFFEQVALARARPGHDA